MNKKAKAKGKQVENATRGAVEFADEMNGGQMNANQMNANATSTKKPRKNS